ncbi:hypothetical protein ABGV42_00285 [Paenibacillus pabuli]|uniref:hypothetical protein n=1 Tax=Paenibacillus pabuli TaxID=1472 RepID=UPI00324287B5
MAVNVEKQAKDAYLYGLRKNSILNWTEELRKIVQYKDILKEVSFFSTLALQNGIVKIEPSGRYIGHKYAPLVKSGFTFTEIAVLLKSEIAFFENEYGEVNLATHEIDKLNEVAYKYNRILTSNLDMNDEVKLNRLSQTASVLFFTLANSVTLKAQSNGSCTLTFANDNNKTNEYNTIFSEEEILLLEKVNDSIKQRVW